MTAQHPGAQVDRPTAMLNVRFLDHLIAWAVAALGRRTNPLCGNGESRFPPRRAVRCCAARYFVAYRLWERFREAPWQRIVRDGLVPVTIGLIIAGGAVMAHAAATEWQAVAVTMAAVVLMLRRGSIPFGCFSLAVQWEDSVYYGDPQSWSLAVSLLNRREPCCDRGHVHACKDRGNS